LLSWVYYGRLKSKFIRTNPLFDPKEIVNVPNKDRLSEAIRMHTILTRNKSDVSNNNTQPSEIRKSEINQSLETEVVVPKQAP